MAAANAQIGVANAAFYPSITLAPLLGYREHVAVDAVRCAEPDLVDRRLADSSRCSTPAGCRRTSISRKPGYDATVANYRRVVLTAMQEVEDGITGVAALERASAQAAKAVASAQRVLELATARYEGGARGLPRRHHRAAGAAERASAWPPSCRASACSPRCSWSRRSAATGSGRRGWRPVSARKGSLGSGQRRSTDAASRVRAAPVPPAALNSGLQPPTCDSTQQRVSHEDHHVRPEARIRQDPPGKRHRLGPPARAGRAQPGCARSRSVPRARASGRRIARVELPEAALKAILGAYPATAELLREPALRKVRAVALAARTLGRDRDADEPGAASDREGGQGPGLTA